MRTFKCGVCRTEIKEGMPCPNCAAGVVSPILEERGRTHGDVEEQADIYDRMIRIMEPYFIAKAINPVQKQSLRVIALKMSRIIAGNPNEPDHWKDIEGYAKLGGGYRVGE